MATGIYVIKKNDEPVYVGMSRGIFRRWDTHEKRWPATEYDYEILEHCEPEVLLSKEKVWINKLDTYYNGENLTGKQRKKRVVIKREKKPQGYSRKQFLLSTFRDEVCGCGESELVCLTWFPHHKKIRHLILRHAVNSKERQQALKLIEECKPLCSNCAAKHEFDQLGFVL